MTPIFAKNHLFSFFILRSLTVRTAWKLPIIGRHPFRPVRAESKRRLAEERRLLAKAAPEAVQAEPWIVQTPPAGDGLASIIILCCNEVDYTRQCLESVLRHTRTPYELVLVDNGSTDGTAEYLQLWEERQKIARRREPLEGDARSSALAPDGAAVHVLGQLLPPQPGLTRGADALHPGAHAPWLCTPAPPGLKRGEDAFHPGAHAPLAMHSRPAGAQTRRGCVPPRGSRRLAMHSRPAGAQTRRGCVPPRGSRCLAMHSRPAGAQTRRGCVPPRGSRPLAMHSRPAGAQTRRGCVPPRGSRCLAMHSRPAGAKTANCSSSRGLLCSRTGILPVRSSPFCG